VSRIDDVEVSLNGQHREHVPDVVLRSPPNWTAVAFFAALSGLHLFFATSAFLHQRWEAFLSVIFGVVFALLAIACRLIATEVAVIGRDVKVLRLRTGTRRYHIERLIPFSRVSCVRLTLLDPVRPESATIEIVCPHEVIDCPPTHIPREEALCLAVTMNVRLVKVYGAAFTPAAERIDSLTHS
jgi:hypothetical protein